MADQEGLTRNIVLLGLRPAISSPKTLSCVLVEPFNRVLTHAF